jgi:ABC-2 type transport system ATP-binding protein
MCDFIFMIFKGEKVLDGTLHDIQDQYGTDRLRIRPEDGAGDLSQIPGIEGIDDMGQVKELKLSEGTDSHEVIRQVLRTTRIRSIEVARPSLHDIFVRIAGPEAEKAEEKTRSVISS